MRKQTTLASVKEIKRGGPKFGEWVLFEVYDEDKVKYSVFNSVLSQTSAAIGDRVQIEFDEEPWNKNGKSGTNKKITSILTLVKSGGLAGVTPKAVPVQRESAPESPKTGQNTQLDRIEAKVDEVLKRIP